MTNSKNAGIYFSPLALILMFSINGHAETMTCSKVLNVTKLSAAEKKAMDSTLEILNQIKNETKLSKKFNTEVLPEPTAKGLMTEGIFDVSAIFLEKEAEIYQKKPFTDDQAGKKDDLWQYYHQLKNTMIGADGYVVFVPNDSFFRTKFGAMPFVAEQSHNGQLKNVRALFSDEQIRRSLGRLPVPSNNYSNKYEIISNGKLARGEFYPEREPSEGDDILPADVFFANLDGKKEFKSLSEAAGFKFRTVMSLSEDIYVVQRYNEKMILLQYNPKSGELTVLAEPQTKAGRETNELTSIFFNPKNREAASIFKFEDHLMIFTQTHTVHMEVARRNGVTEPSFLEIKPREFGNVDGSSYPRKSILIKVHNTSTKSNLVPTILTAVRTPAPFSQQALTTIYAQSEDGSAKMKWTLQDVSEFSGTAYRVKGGYVLQRDSVINLFSMADMSADPYFPRRQLRIDRRIYFLSDNGEVTLVSPYPNVTNAAEVSQKPSLGFLSLIDGTLSVIAEGGIDLLVKSFPQWKY